jgi:localization factor PodJL
MNKPNYGQLRAEIQDLSRSRARAKAPDRRGDAWRDFDDEEATEDGFVLEDDETEFLIEDEDDDPFADPPRRISRRLAANERHARALQKIAQLVDESRYGVSRSRGLDQALDALSRSINASERRTARALETIVAELIEDERGPLAARRRRRLSRRAIPIDAPARSLVPEHDQAVDDPDRAPEALAERLEGGAPRSGASEGRRAGSEASVAKLPLADAILDITRRQQSLNAGADARDPGSDEPGASAPAEGGARRFSGEMEALERKIGALRGDLDNSAERERHIMLQVDGLREEIRILTRGVGELAPRASVEAIECALADLAERVDAQRERGVADQALAPAERIAGELRAVLEEIDPRPHMQELQADMRRLANRLDQLEAGGDAGEASLQELAHRTAEIKESLSALAARPLPLEQIETRLRDLTIRVDKLTSGPSSGERSHELIDAAKAIRAILSAETGSDAFNQRLDGLSAKLEEALARFDGNRFEELGARIDEMHQSLAQRIDQGMLQASPHVVALEGLLADLAEKVDHALAIGRPPVAVASLEDKVDRLDEKLDRLGPGALAEQLEELLARAKPSEESRLAEITERLDVMQRTLATQIDESARWRKDDSHKAQLSALLEQLAARSAEACGPGADPAAVNALSEQVRQLSARLDRSLNDGATLASIESKIAELCEKIEDSRTSAARAAETAARGAAPDPRQQSEPEPLPSPQRQLDTLDDLFEAQEGARTQDAATTAPNAAVRAADCSSACGNEDGEASAESARGEAPEGAQGESSDGALADAREAPRPEPQGAGSTPHWGRRRQDMTGSGPGAPSSARAAGVDLELKQQADFIAAARRAAERAGAEAVPTCDRKTSIKELEASRGPHSGPSKGTNASAAPNRKTLILAGLTGAALIVAAAPIGRAVFDQTGAGSAVQARATGEGAPSGSSQKLTLNVPSSLAQKFGLSEHDAAAAKSPSEGALVGTTNGLSDGSAAKPERKSVAAERLDPTPVGAIERAPAALPQEAAALQALAQRGDAKAQFELGARYAEGRGGLPRDSKLAAQWFSKAADQGVAIAQYRLGASYEKGVGVERSYERARSLYEKAANAGNARAMHNLGVLFVENGDGWPDYASAAGWFRKAAEYGVRDSQFNLAVLYARGMGVEQNLVQAYMWFSVAAAQGDAEAARKRDEVAARLDARDLATAKSMAEAFKPKAPAHDANDTEPPRNTGPSVNPSARQSDGPTASAAFNGPKMSGM